MTAFFRGLILFLFGVLSGAAGMLFFTPSFNVVVTRGKTPVRLIEFPRAPAGEPAPAETVVAGSPAAPKPVANTDTEEPAAPVTAAEPALDFEAISRHLIVWPSSVSTKSATIVEVPADGDKTQPLALEAGAVLQLSKVRADGMLEVRAKGAKFVIQSSLTDFAAEVTKRAAELAAKGAPADEPTAAGAPTAATPAPKATPVAPTAPAAPATLDDRVNTLFGKKRSGAPSNEAKPKEAEKKKEPFAR